MFFAHFDPQNEIDEYVQYYLKHLHELGCFIIFVSGSPELKPEAAATILPYCMGIYTRQSLGYDFGCWHLAWCLFKQKGWGLKQFDRLLLANDSVYGPLFDLKEMLCSFSGADVYGASENLEIERHLQSYFLLWELNDQTRLFLENYWNTFRYVVEKDQVVWKCEVGISKRARAAGLTLKPYVTAERALELVRRDPNRQYADLLLQGDNSYIVYLWDGLIEELRFPF